MTTATTASEGISFAIPFTILQEFVADQFSTKYDSDGLRFRKHLGKFVFYNLNDQDDQQKLIEYSDNMDQEEFFKEKDNIERTKENITNIKTIYNRVNRYDETDNQNSSPIWCIYLESIGKGHLYFETKTKFVIFVKNYIFGNISFF